MSNELRVLLYTDDGEKHPVGPRTSKDYNLMIVVSVVESPWAQIEEMLAEASIDVSRYTKSSIHIDIEGTLGLNCIAHVKDLATHGTITWYISEASVASLREAFGPLATIHSLPH
jgi:hypothetical protein